MGNALHIPSCASFSSADVMCMRSVYSLRSAGCGGRGGVASCGGVRVVHTGTGEVIEASEGTTAAEIMMEHPNHFLICSTTADLAPGKRFAPLASHQELLPNHLYLLLPMHKLRTRLSVNDQTVLSQLSHKLKHFPASAAPPIAPFLLPVSALSFCANTTSRTTAPSTLSCMQNAHDVAVGEHVTLLSSYINRTPPPASLIWRPSLQTIDETPHLRSWTFREGLVM